MGTLGSLQAAALCRLCGEDTAEGVDVFGAEVGEEAVALAAAALQLLRLRLSPASPLPRVACPACCAALAAAVDFAARVARGQARLAGLLGEQGRRGRGRPRRAEGGQVSLLQPPPEGSMVGRRKTRLPKRFAETVHSLKPGVEDDKESKDVQVDVEKSNPESDFTVTIDLSTTKSSQNPVIDEINNILNQFDQKGKESEVRFELFACEICEKTFVNQKQLEEHMSLSHGEIMYKCEVSSCSALLRTKGDLGEHQATSGHTEFVILEVAGGPAEVDGGPAEVAGGPAEVGGEQAESASGGSRDVAPRVFACTEEGCARQFGAASSLTYHRLAAHHRQAHPCTHPGCAKTFRVRNLLTRHLKTHASERSYVCDKCDKTFKTQSNLSSHKTVHVEESKFFCDECGQQFKHRTSLVSHMRWHKGSKPFKCPYCNKSFNQNGNLQEHTRIHTGEKPFKCHLCPRQFTTSSQHKLHVKRHLGLKQFKCDFCSKSFLNNDTFKTHLRRHKGEKPYGCKLCKKSFAESWALTKHMRFHSGVQPYLCKECGKKFSDSSNLAKHKKIHEEGGGGTAKAVWEMVRSGAEQLVEEDKEDVQQVIYIAYEDGEEKAIEGALKGGKLDLAVLAAQGLRVEEVAGKVEEVQPKEEASQTIEVTTRDGREVRLVAPSNIDPLAFAAEYLKDLPE